LQFDYGSSLALVNVHLADGLFEIERCINGNTADEQRVVR
jgi:hypothetical protein